MTAPSKERSMKRVDKPARSPGEEDAALDDPSLPGTAAPSARKPTPAQKAMKQFSKTPAERGETAGQGEGPASTREDRPTGTRPGDAGVGESGNQGSSPYGDRARREESEREEPER